MLLCTRNSWFNYENVGTNNLDNHTLSFYLIISRKRCLGSRMKENMLQSHLALKASAAWVVKNNSG